MARHVLRTASAIPALAVLLFLLSLASPAAALDCGKAADPISKAICASPALLEADAALATRYSAVLRKLKGAGRSLLVDSQRQWLAERQGDCRDDLAACIGTSIAARQKSLAVCFAGSTASELVAAVPSCPYYLHRGCPTLTATGPAGLKAYPFLVDLLIEEVRSQIGDFGCGPDDPDSASNEAGEDYTLETERPGLVCVRVMSEAYFSGAAHPMSSESLDCYDTASTRKLGVASVLPGLTPDSADFEKIVALVDGHLEQACCEGMPTTDGSFDGIGGEASLPSGWAVTEAGDLMLAFTYSAYGRSFIATAVLPQATVIDMVAAPYRRFFVAAGNKPR